MAVRTAATTVFQDLEPEIAELMSNITFTIEQMNGLLAWLKDYNASPEEGAVHFLTDNKDICAVWLDDVARERLSGVLR